jgi:hypothetical protein
MTPPGARTPPGAPVPSASVPLADRVDALGRFLRGVAPVVTAYPYANVDADLISAAQSLVERGGARLRLFPDHVVVALAGATGGGKSSLFNALVRLSLSPAGHLRPTTGEAHACVWNPRGADALLDWLGVDPAWRFIRESALDADDEARLRGLVLLDLPDMDSIATGHRVEVDRLARIVDVMVWVLDPQKYADSTVHEGYLRHMGALREVTVVVFNQIDRLTPADAARCLADLTRLVAADGLPGVPILPTSATTGDGVDDLRGLLEKAVAGRSASLVRLEGELDDMVVRLSPLVGAAVGEEVVRRELLGWLADQLAVAAGVDAAVDAAGREYERRAAVPGWPSRRRTGTGAPLWPAETGFPADPAAVAAAVRTLAAATSAGLPPPWQHAVRAAASAELDAIPAELERRLRQARPVSGGGVGWWAVRALWWLAVALTLAGAGWLVWRLVAGGAAAGLASPAVLAGGGLVLGTMTLVLARLRAATLARRIRLRTDERLREATRSVAREVVAPVRTVLRAYEVATADFAEALPRR